MTHYRILAPHFVAGISVAADSIFQAAPILGWSVGKDFVFFRDYCKQKGWTVEPQCEPHEPQWLEYHGRVYELRWRDGALTRISLHEDGEVTDLTYKQLPELLRKLL